MSYRALKACGLSVAAFAVGGAPAMAATGDLDAYRVKSTPKTLDKLAAAGFDVSEGGDRENGTIEIVGTEAQVRAAKVGAEVVQDSSGATSSERSGAGRSARRARAAAPIVGASDTPFTVWTKYDAFDEVAAGKPDKEQYTEQYARLVTENPGLVAKRVTGTTYGGREIVALQVTKGATGADIPGRPAVLYNAMQHAREWLAGETCRRTLDYFVENYGKTTSSGLEVTKLVDENELWFVCVNNPDGYEFTFTEGNRLWRKNLRDNDGDGIIKPGDGVDPNRNFSSNWGRDDDGSSPDPADETYRGPGPASEPETKAMETLFAEIKPVFQKNDHTAAQLLLYPQGFQQDTPTADNEIFAALAGDPFKPGIEGFLPELSAGLYITNGDFTDWAYSSQKTLSYTPEGTAAEDPAVSGFEYADSPLQVQQEFDRHLPFALDLAKSAKDPTEPSSHLGNKAKPIVADEFPVSYGDPQPVQATVQRKLGVTKLRYRINGGPARQVDTTEYTGGERYNKNDAVYYRRVRGTITGTSVNDQVETWFVAGGVESNHFTYKAVEESKDPVLLLSDEDWSGKNPGPSTGPAYLDAYKALLTQAGVAFDEYDVARDRRRPDPLGVLAHYSHVVWYTGDDLITRAPDAKPGSGIDRLAVDTQNDVRDFLNDGGKLFFTGQNAGRQFADGYTYNPFQKEEGEYCDTSTNCIAVQDDFLQYWLGAGSYIGDGGLAPDDSTYGVRGATEPFSPGPFGLDDAGHTASLLVTSSLYDPAKYPQWADSKKAMGFERPGGSPFEPFTGEWFVSAGTENSAYKRLQQEVDLSGKTAAELSFRTSFDLEVDYDYVFVEIRHKGQDDWTTLEEKNGLTSQDTGAACEVSTPRASNWSTVHPFIAHYQTSTNAGKSCNPTGSSGAWWAATGKSGGWKQWQLDIPAAYRTGGPVEIAVTVASDSGVSGLGTWIDDAKLTADGATLNETSFEADRGAWTTPGPPTGTRNAVKGWERAQGAPFVEGAAVTTPDTVFTGFGLEKLEGTAAQVAVMKDVFEHLGVPVKPAIPASPSSPVAGGGVGAGNGNGPPPGRPVGPGKVKVLKLDRQMLKTARRLGVRVYARCEGGCKLRLELRVDRATARRYKLKSIIVGKATVTLTGNQGKRVRVKFTRTALTRLKNAKRLRLTVVGTTDGKRSLNATTLR